MVNQDKSEHEEEMVDAVDHNGKKIGVVSRRVANRIGIWHYCAQVFVIVGHGSSSAILFQRRSRNKKVSPGVLDISASGHVPAGETTRTTAAQELHEELGIAIPEDDFVYVGRRIDMYEDGRILSRIFADVYITSFDALPATLRYQEAELDELVLVQVKDILDIFLLDARPECEAYSFDEVGKLSKTTVTVKAADFLPRIDNLYLRVARYASEGRGSLSAAYI
jgi:isopentenyldiphosphate isomerase